MNRPSSAAAPAVSSGTVLLEYRLSLPDVLKVLPDGELLHESLWIYGIRYDTTNGRTPKTKIFDEGVFVPRSIASSVGGGGSEEDNMPALLPLEDAQRYVLGCILNHSDELKFTRLANWIQRTQTRQKKLLLQQQQRIALLHGINYSSSSGGGNGGGGVFNTSNNTSRYPGGGVVSASAAAAASSVPVSLLCDTHESMMYVAAVRDDTEWDAPVPPLVWRALEDRFRKDIDRFTLEYLGETVTGKWVLTDTSTKFKVGSSVVATTALVREEDTNRNNSIITTPPSTPLGPQKRQTSDRGGVDVDISGLSPIQRPPYNKRTSSSSGVRGIDTTATIRAAGKSSLSAPPLLLPAGSDDDDPLVILTRTPISQPLGLTITRESNDQHSSRTSLLFDEDDDDSQQHKALSPSSMASLQRIPSVVRDELIKHHKLRKGVPSSTTKQFMVRLYLVAISPIPPPLLALWLDDVTHMCTPAVVSSSLGVGSTSSATTSTSSDNNNNAIPQHLDLSPSAKQQLAAKGLPYISCPKPPEKISALPQFGKCVDWRFFLLHVLRGASKHDFEQRRQALNELLLVPSWDLDDEQDDDDNNDLKDVAMTDQMEDGGDGTPPLNPKLALKALESRGSGKNNNIAATVVVREHVPLAALHSTKLEHIVKYGLFSILETHTAQSSLDSGVTGASAACTVAESAGSGGGKGTGGLTTRGGAKWSLLADDGGGEIFRPTEEVNGEHINTDEGKKRNSSANNNTSSSSSSTKNNTTKKYARIVGSRGGSDNDNGTTRSANVLVELQLDHGVVTGTFIPDANLFIMASLNQELFGYTIKENNIAIALMPSSKRNGGASTTPSSPSTTSSMSGQSEAAVEKSAKPMYTVELQHTTLFPYDASSSLYCTKQSILFISTIDGKVVIIPGGNLKSENVALRGTIDGWGVPSHVVTLLESPTVSSLSLLPNNPSYGTAINNNNMSFSNMTASNGSILLSSQQQQQPLSNSSSTLLIPPHHQQRQRPLREPIVSLATVPKFNRLICGSLMGSVASIRSGKVDGMLPGVEERPGGVLCILTMPDLHTIATCGHSPTIHLWTMAFQHNSTSSSTTAGSPKGKAATQQRSRHGGGSKASDSSSCLVGQLRDSGNPHASPIVFLWRATQDDVPSDCNKEACVFQERLLSVDVAGTVKLWDLGLQCCIVTCAQRTPMHVLSCQVIIGSTRQRREYLVAKKVAASTSSHSVAASSGGGGGYINNTIGGANTSISYPIGSTQEIIGYTKHRPTITQIDPSSSSHFPDYSSVVEEAALKAAKQQQQPTITSPTTNNNNGGGGGNNLGAVLHGLGGTESTVRLVAGEGGNNGTAASSSMVKPPPSIITTTHQQQRRKSLGVSLAIQTPDMEGGDGQNSDNNNNNSQQQHQEDVDTSHHQARVGRSISYSGAPTTTNNNTIRPAGSDAEVMEDDAEEEGANLPLDIRVKLCVVNTAAFRLELHEVAVKLNESGHFDGSDDKVQQIIVGGATSVAIAEQALIKAAERSAKMRRGGPTAGGLSQSNKHGRNLIQVGYSLGDGGGGGGGAYGRKKQIIKNIPRQVATIFMTSINAYVAIVNDSIVIIDSKSKEVEGRYTGICEQYMMAGKFLGTVDDAQASDRGPLAAAADAASSSTAKSKPPNVVVTATAVSEELRTLFVGCEGGSDVLAISVSTGSVQARLRMNTVRTNQRNGFPTAIQSIASTESNAQIAAAASLDSAQNNHNNNTASSRSKKCTVIVGSSTGVVALFLIVPSSSSLSSFKKGRNKDGAAVDESGGGVMSMDERATAEIIVPTHQITASHCGITRFGWHAISRIVAMGDAEGNFTQWEVFSNQLSKCTTLRQPEIMFSNQSRHMRSSSYQSQQESDKLASGGKKGGIGHETEIENASALISHITRKQHERDQSTTTTTTTTTTNAHIVNASTTTTDTTNITASTTTGGGVEATQNDENGGGDDEDTPDETTTAMVERSVETSKLNQETDQFLYGLFTGEGRYEITAISSLAPFFGFVVADSSGKCRVWTTAPYDAAAIIFEWTPRVDKHSPTGGIPIPTALVLETTFESTPITSSVFTPTASDRIPHEQQQDNTPTHNAPPQTFMHVVDDQGVYSCWSLTSALSKSGLAFDVPLKCEEVAATPKIEQLISPARSRLINATQLLRKTYNKQALKKIPTQTVASSALSLLRATRDAAAAKRRCVSDLLKSGDGSTITDPQDLLTRFPSLHARIAMSPSASDCPAVSMQLTHTGTDGILIVVGLGTGDTILLRPATTSTTTGGGSGKGSSSANTPVMGSGGGGGGTRSIAQPTYSQQTQHQLRFGYLHPLQAKKGPVFEVAPVGRLADFGFSSSGVFSFSESITSPNHLTPNFASDTAAMTSIADFANQDTIAFKGGQGLLSKKPPRTTKKGAIRAAVGVTLHCQLPAPPASPTNTVDVFPRHRITSALDAGSAHRTIPNSGSTPVFSPPRSTSTKNNNQQHCTTTSPTLLPTDKMMTTNTNPLHHHESDMLVDTMDETQTMSNTTFLSRHRDRAPEITRYLAAVCDRLHALIEVGDDTFNLLVNPPSKFFDPQMTSALSAPPAAALGGHAGPVVEEDNIREGAGVRPSVSHIINSVIAASSLHAKKSTNNTATPAHHQPLWMFTIATDTSLFNSLPPLRDLSSQQRDTTMIHYPTNDGDQTSKEKEESKIVSSHRHIHNRQHQNNLSSIRRRQHSSSPTRASKVEVHNIVVEKDVFNVEVVEQHPTTTHQPFSDTLDYFKIKPQPGGAQKQRVSATALSTYSSHLVSRPNHHAPTGKPTTVFGQQVLDNDTRTYYGGVIGDGSSEVDTSTTTLLTTTPPKRMSVPKKSLRRSLVGQSRQNTSSTTTVRPNSAASSTFLMKMLNGRDHDVSIGPSSVPTTGLSPLPDVDYSSPCVGEEEGVSCSPPPTASSSAIRRGSPERGKRELPFDIVGNEYRNEDRTSLAVAASNRELNNNTTTSTSVITNHNGINSSSTSTALKRRPMSAAVAGRHLEASANMRRGRINMHLTK